MNLENAKNLMAKATVIIDLMKELYSVEDDYLEIWLMNGCPDGATIGEIIEYVEDNDTYLEWVNLAHKLLKYREKEDCE